MKHQLLESEIIRALAEKIAQQLARKVIFCLQSRKDALLSGVDSGLENSCDEICVQVQCEQSFFGDAYDDTVRLLVEGYMTGLLPYESEALWLQTAEGEEWSFEDAEDRESYPVLKGDIANYLMQNIYGKAADYGNSRIRAYLDKG